MSKFRNLIFGVAVCATLPLIASTSFAQNNKNLEQRLAAMEQQVFIQQGRIAALEAKLKYVTVDGTDMIISGANLHLRNGTGSMSNKNGLGNLTIGYNDNTGFNERTGSHNLLIGRYLTYTSYGSIVTGENNQAKGDYSSILSASECATLENADYSALMASFDCAISKGHGSIISAQGSQVNGYLSGILGGENNILDGEHSVIAGGHQNKVWFMSSYSTLAGGFNNQIWKGTHNNILGGYNNQIFGDYSVISGGQGGTVEAFIMAGSISGGDGNTIHNNYSSIGGGHNLTTTINMQFKGGGLTG